MFVQTVETPGVAALSYVVGAGGGAVVIDPRRDIDVYLDTLRSRGLRLVAVIETHRHEDFVSGARALADRTGARLLHGPGVPRQHGEVADDGEEISFGDVTLTIRLTPGHTDDSLSVVLRHAETGEDPVGVFTGDALFVHDVGRTDFHPERLEEDAATLYTSLHDVLLPLGDGVLVWPAHGAGSVCGDGMADRNVTTLGYERANNPALQLDRDAFVERKVAEEHVTPPYFARMEAMNSDGAPAQPLPLPRPWGADQLAEKAADVQIVDVRSHQAYAGSHVPGSVSLPGAMVTGYGGFLLDHERPIVLVDDGEGPRTQATEHLFRMGYDKVVGFLKGGVVGWETSGRELGSVGTMSPKELAARLDEVGEAFTLLDVRKPGEWEGGHLPGATHVFLGDLPDRLDEVPRDRPVVTFCGSGKRAMVAASILASAGYDDVRNCFGSMKACKALGCEVVTG